MSSSSLYKAVIIDDEAVVRTGLKNTIDWPAHGFELVGDYENGRDAWEAIATCKPDLIVSDISMPYMDGLELAGLVAAQYPYIKMIILTGYDEFEYAQQALRLKVSDFVLKPITAREIRQLLDKTRLEMDAEVSKHKDWQRLQAQLNQSLPLLQERFLERLSVLGLGPAEIAERFAFFRLAPLASACLVIVADIDDFGGRELQGSGPWDEHDAEFLRFAAYNIFSEITQRESLLHFRTREGRMAAIVGGSGEADLYEIAFRIAEEIRHLIERYLKFTVTFGVGRVCDSASSLPLAYKSAAAALEYRFLLGKNRVIGIFDVEGKSAVSPQLADWDRKLAAALKTGTLQEAYGLIEAGVQALKLAFVPIESCLVQVQRTMLTLLHTMQELEIELPAGTFDPQTMLDVYRFKTLDEIEVSLKEIAGRMMTAIQDNRHHLTNMQIRRAVAYIESHYAHEKLTLQEVCRHVTMSTSYFSQIFKQITGDTFVEYLTGVRMSKAKELLKCTSLKFYEIAAQVGYADPNYFSILFKKQTGLSPKDYREQLTKESG